MVIDDRHTRYNERTMVTERIFTVETCTAACESIPHNTMGCRDVGHKRVSAQENHPSG